MGVCDRNRTKIVESALAPMRYDGARAVVGATERVGHGNGTDEDLGHAVAPTAESGGDE